MRGLDQDARPERLTTRRRIGPVVQTRVTDQRSDRQVRLPEEPVSPKK